ncbi:MAG: hypothetical protein AAF961_07645 [Planctomycetota bacterium]
MRGSRRRIGPLPSLVLALAIPAGADAGMIQFGVAELPGRDQPHGDSFVIEIDEGEVELIEHARALVDWINAGGDPIDSPGATILVTEIASGSDGVNRNYLADSEPPWSWHPVGTPWFSDTTIEILDGWPTFVESDVADWMANTNGFVGFWEYTIVSEIGSSEPGGDFDRDGRVDGLDFLHWQRGSSPNPRSPTDLLEWQTNFGKLVQKPAASAVAEPATFPWSLIGLTLLMIFHRPMGLLEWRRLPGLRPLP